MNVSAITVTFVCSSDRKSTVFGTGKHVFLSFLWWWFLPLPAVRVHDVPTAACVCAERQVRVHEERVILICNTNTIALIQPNMHLYGKMTQRHTYKDMPGLCGGLLRFLDMTVERWTKAASTMALPSVLISCSSWHRIHVTICLLSLPPARHRLGPTQTSALSHELGLWSKERTKN